MNPGAEELIAELGLLPHPEGGHYREYFRDRSRVRPSDGRGERSALTGIYFLLARGEVSRWHRVASAEAWLHHLGDPLELWTADPGGGRVERIILGPPGPESAPARVVEAGRWQAARTLGDFTLVSCAVGPGFEFEDFEFLADFPGEAEAVRRLDPEAARLI